MWEVLTGWFGSVFNFFRSTLAADRDNFQAVIKTQNEVITSMQSRIDTMDREFKQAMDRRDAEVGRAVARIAGLEESEQRCRTSLNKAKTAIAYLRSQIKILQDHRDLMEKVKAIREDPSFQANTMKHTEVLIVEKDRETKVEELPRTE